MRNNSETSSIKEKYFGNKKNIFVMCIIILVIIIVSIIIYKSVFKKSETYTVVNGYVEKSNDTQGVVIKQEQLINLSNNNAIIPLIEQGKRVRKFESVAIYKDNNYQEYINKVNELDKQIETLIKDLPQMYSNDISYIENQIELLGKQAKKTTSYIKIQEYKTKIDELSNQKITLLGELSPSGSKVRELIEKRTQIEESYKNSSDNIKSPMSGCITYKIDGLENCTDISKTFTYTASDIDNILSKYKENVSSDFGIKVVNNFLAYLIVKVQNNDYIKEGNSYYIRFTDKTDLKESAILSKIISIDEENKYCIFKITNGIEKIVDSRIENIEIIWTKKSGMAVPLNGITLEHDSNIGKVTIIKNGDYAEAIVKVVLANDNIAIVENLTDEEKLNNNIQNNNKLEVFDQLVIKE